LKFLRQRPRLDYLSSRRLETKTLVSRTTSLVLWRVDFISSLTLYSQPHIVRPNDRVADVASQETTCC